MKSRKIEILKAAWLWFLYRSLIPFIKELKKVGEILSWLFILKTEPVKKEKSKKPIVWKIVKRECPYCRVFKTYSTEYTYCDECNERAHDDIRLSLRIEGLEDKILNFNKYSDEYKVSLYSKLDENREELKLHVAKYGPIPNKIDSNK